MDPYYQKKCEPSITETVTSDTILLKRKSYLCNGKFKIEIFFENGSIKEKYNYKNLAFGYPLGLRVPDDLGLQLEKSYFYYEAGAVKIQLSESVSGYWTADQNYFKDH
ncbi:MAG: hypothetical protein HRU38_14880, partial [Saccharospirillaceae bacterium]|nr:hypothetical protein [Saccharospirillaceae bacterium]